MIDKQLIKIIGICSCMTGAIIGAAHLIPFLGLITILLIMFFIAPFIIVYFKHLNLIKNISTEQSLIIGAASGASAFLGFACIYFPLAFILYLIFKIQAFIWVKVLVTNVVFLVPMVILIAMLCALLNAFSGFLTVYFINLFRQK